MNYSSRLLWIAIDDVPKMIHAGMGFCVNCRAWDTEWCVVQLYDNDYILDLDKHGIDWQYPTVNPGGSVFARRKK
jgi:hypothetical protein